MKKRLPDFAKDKFIRAFRKEMAVKINRRDRYIVKQEIWRTRND